MYFTFLFIYFFFIYLYIFILFFGFSYDKTKERVRKTWLFNKIKGAFTLEGEAIIFFFQMGFLIASFGIFCWAYKLMFGEVEKDNLVNPLQVLAQCFSFVFYFFPFNKNEGGHKRHLMLVLFLLSILSSLFLRGICLEMLIFLYFVFSICLCFMSLDSVLPLILFFYSLDQELSRWGFFLAFQQSAYYMLSFLLEKEELIPRKRISTLICILPMQLLVGFFFYKELYFKEPARLIALLSGVCVLFLSFRKRSGWAFKIPALFFVFLSTIIGLASSQDKIPFEGLLLFYLSICVSLLGFYLFSRGTETQLLLQVFFFTLVYYLPYLPELEWLGKWIKGMDLLLFFLGIFLSHQISRK